MPMDFPDLNSLIKCGAIHKFRLPKENETEDSYRQALAYYVQPIDFIESLEIRNKVGWDRFSDQQNKDMLRRKGFNV